MAYEESLAAVQYISDTYGMSDLQRILERLGQGSSTEAALRATIHSDYGQLEAEVGKYLDRQIRELGGQNPLKRAFPDTDLSSCLFHWSSVPFLPIHSRSEHTATAVF